MSAEGRAGTILVVDDEAFVRDSLIEILENEGFRAAAARGVDEARHRLAEIGPALVITDLRMPAGSGMDVLAEARRVLPLSPVIVLTGVGTVADAVTAMKAGAFDFIEKPVDPEELLIVVRRALEHRRLSAEVEELRRTVGRLREPPEMAGVSPAFARLRGLIEQVARTDATVLITGESGTGKELVALEIHRASRRAAGSFVAVNCAAVAETLFESEFFGHRRGAFTGAVADRPGRFAEAEGGTLVLDEIGTLRPEMQAKLLRVLESGEYQPVGESRSRRADVRVIAVTNEDLGAAVAEGSFRGDLFYRLNVFPIRVPPLRERREDVGVIAAHLLRRLRATWGAAEEAAAAEGLSPEVAAVLEAYRWPGNVRELRNVLERAVILAGGRVPDAAIFREILGDGARAEGTTDRTSLNLRERVDVLERDLILEALARTGGKKREASALLGVDPRNLGYYLRKHGLSEKGPSGGGQA